MPWYFSQSASWNALKTMNENCSNRSKQKMGVHAAKIYKFSGDPTNFPMIKHARSVTKEVPLLCSNASNTFIYNASINFYNGSALIVLKILLGRGYFVSHAASIT